MGCSSNKGAQPSTPAIRRRLSLGDVGPDDTITPATKAEYNEEDRSLLMVLSSQDVHELAEGGGGNEPPVGGTKSGRVSSLGSQTDKDMHRAKSFASKRVQAGGAKLELVANAALGYACKKGKKPESPNQDSFFVMRCEGEFCIYGVFDGHGHHGHDVSNYVKENLPKLMLQHAKLQDNPLEAIRGSFDRMQRIIIQASEMGKLNANRSGTTCSVIFHDLKTNTLHVGHVGDSRCVIARTDPKDPTKNTAIDLTHDHKPDDPAERARIEKAGGRVVYDGGWNYRVYATNGERGPGLNMSRAMGDLGGYFHAGISATPDVISHIIDVSVPKEGPTSVAKKDCLKDKGSGSQPVAADAAVSSLPLEPNCDQFILLCSDGVWEFLSSQDAINLVTPFKKEKAMEAAECLAQKSWDNWNKESQARGWSLSLCSWYTSIQPLPLYLYPLNLLFRPRQPRQ